MGTIFKSLELSLVWLGFVIGDLARISEKPVLLTPKSEVYTIHSFLSSKTKILIWQVGAQLIPNIFIIFI